MKLKESPGGCVGCWETVSEKETFSQPKSDQFPNLQWCVGLREEMRWWGWRATESRHHQGRWRRKNNLNRTWKLRALPDFCFKGCFKMTLTWVFFSWPRKENARIHGMMSLECPESFKWPHVGDEVSTSDVVWRMQSSQSPTDVSLALSQYLNTYLC